MSLLRRFAALREALGAADRYKLLEREIEAIQRFPGQNPNPVLRATPAGRLIYANAASEPIVRTLGIDVGDDLPNGLFARLVEVSRDTPPRAVELQSGLQTFAVLAVHVPELGVYNLYGTDITGAKVVEKFPDQNPNPVFRMSEPGELIYANAASLPIISSLGVSVGAPLPGPLCEAITRRLSGGSDEPIEVHGDGRTYELNPVAIREFGFVNVYGTDVTARRAIDKFPNENPNPVLRVTRQGVVTYANPASRAVRAALGAEVGDQLSPEVWGRLAAAADATGPQTVEVEGDGCVYALKVVSVYEFDSINIYGTDITAAREIERANAENERLLLNILPASIADRLKRGEAVIADRFEEMAVLFADVVNFTPFASELPPAEVVDALNGVFSIFDRLADRHGLEKIKTIGDAYMVVGGLVEDPNQPELVARLGLEMIDELAQYQTRSGVRFQIRVGMHVGPVVGGIIGLKKFIYDVWGDTVNTASRMESYGVPGRVTVSQAAFERLRHAYEFEPRAPIDVKGKGPMQTYLLVAPARNVERARG